MLQPQRQQNPSDIVVKARGLTRSFGEHIAVEDLDLEMLRGEVVALLGPNGAGKTTTVRMFAGLLSPTAGELAVLGCDLSNGADSSRLRSQIGLLTETPGLYDRATAWYNLLYFARLQKVARPAEAIEKYLRLLDLWERRNETVGGFSKGMKQRLAIARALIHEPQLLLLDEPTSGLDPAAANKLRRFFETLRAEGRTIVLATHNLTEAERLADRVLVVRRRLLAADTASRLRHRLFGRKVVVVADGLEPAIVEELSRVPAVQSLERTADGLRLELANPEKDNAKLVKWLVQRDVSIRWLKEERASLEQIYLQLVGEEREGASQ